MKTPAEQTVPEQTPAEPGTMDMHTSIHDGRLGYATEAEKQALIVSLEQAEKDYEDGKWIDADTVFNRL